MLIIFGYIQCLKYLGNSPLIIDYFSASEEYTGQIRNINKN